MTIRCRSGPLRQPRPCRRIVFTFHDPSHGPPPVTADHRTLHLNQSARTINREEPARSHIGRLRRQPHMSAVFPCFDPPEHATFPTRSRPGSTVASVWNAQGDPGLNAVLNSANSRFGNRPSVTSAATSTARSLRRPQTDWCKLAFIHPMWHSRRTNQHRPNIVLVTSSRPEGKRSQRFRGGVKKRRLPTARPDSLVNEPSGASACPYVLRPQHRRYRR